METPLYRLGRFSARHRWWVVAAWFVLLIGASLIAKAAGAQYNDVFTVPGSQSQTATDILSEHYPQLAGASGQIVFHSKKGTLHDSANKQAVDGSLKNVRQIKRIASASNPYDSQNPTIAKDGTIGYSTIYYKVQPGDLGESDLKALQKATEPATKAGIQVEFGGSPASQAESPTSDAAEIIGISAAIIILLFAFGTAVAMSLPIVTAIFGVGTGIALIELLSTVVDISSTGPIIATMLGLGVGIDYALFVVSRHRREMATGKSIERSAATSISTAGHAVIIAGSTVTVAVLLMAIAGIPLISSLGYSAALMVGVAVVAAITLMPAVLRFAGRHIDSLRLPWVDPHKEPGDPLTTKGGWARWARGIARVPWLYAIVILAIMITIALPAFSMTLGTIDAGSDPAGSNTREAYDLLAEGFGPGVNGPLILVLQAPVPALKDQVKKVYDKVGKTKGVASVSPPAPSPDDIIVAFSAIPDSSPQSPKTADLVNELRDKVLPEATKGTSVTVMVTGVTAGNIDLQEQISKRLIWFFVAIIGFSFLLLMSVFRSILIPVKAALMNILSIGVAYGVIVAVFQWGWGASLIGVDEKVPIASYVPMMMFAILFGLSMDYEMFLMSRVREAHLSGLAPKQAVISGLGGIGRVITSAALIMSSVFFAYMLVDDVVVKMFGLGLAVGVLADAFLVRCTLVPALMDLMGKSAWYIPKSLDRHLPRLDAEGGLPPSVPAEESALETAKR